MNAAEQLQTLAAEIRAKAAPAAHQLDLAASVLDRLFDEAAGASESPAYVILLYAARIQRQSAEALRAIADMAVQVGDLARAKPEIAAESPEFLAALQRAAERLDDQLRRQEKIEAERADTAWRLEGKR